MTVVAVVGAFFLGTAGAANAAVDPIFDLEGGTVLVAAYNANAIVAVAPDGARTTLTSVGCPPDVLLDGSRRLYASSCSGEVRRIDADGTKTTLVTIPGCGNNSNPRLALDADGSVLATDECTGVVRRIAPDGAVTTFDPGLCNSRGIAADTAGNVYVAGYRSTDDGSGPSCNQSPTSGVVLEYPADGSPATTVYHGCPSSLAIDPANSSLLLDDNCAGEIERVTAGVVSVAIATGSTCAFGVRADGTDILASDLCSGAVIRYAADGTATRVATVNGAAGLFVVPPKSEQTISFDRTAPDPAYVKDTYQPSASSDSGLPVAITVDATSTACAISASGLVRFTHDGTCVLDADQSGDATYQAADTVQQTIVVQRHTQTIMFTSTPPAHALVGDSYQVTANGGGSNKPVLFRARTASASVCTVSSAGAVEFIGSGKCRILASQSGGRAYYAAHTVEQDVVVYKK